MVTDDDWNFSSYRIFVRSTANHSIAPNSQMNLYIINEVLYDYTDGMCVIAAESMPHCEQIFMKQFSDDYNKEQQQKDFNSAPIKVIENVNHSEGVVSYVYGGA